MHLRLYLSSWAFVVRSEKAAFSAYPVLDENISIHLNLIWLQGKSSRCGLNSLRKSSKEKQVKDFKGLYLNPPGLGTNPTSHIYLWLLSPTTCGAR